MIILISPAKTLDFESPSPVDMPTAPGLLSESHQLVEVLRQKSPQELAQLMSLSPKLAQLNYERFQTWGHSLPSQQAKVALYAFQGDVYQGLAAAQFSEPDRQFAQKHLRILSGLYGLLRPLDLIQPYRLEMGTALEVGKAKNLYEFWGARITEAVRAALAETSSKALINLASQEYFKAIQPRQVGVPVITPVFKELRGDKYQIVSFFAKKARGLMSAYLIRNRLTEPAALQGFAEEGYAFAPGLSDDKKWVFTRVARF
ncbi:MAG: peroxide stress protein YaaA [Microscillaceae bacterium]|nr:peroxide stress protein YaaA [Microscillaceae bacterium]